MELTDQELFELIHISQRPGMYLGNQEIKSIEAFLIGYDFGRRKEDKIQRQFINFIFSNYRNIKEISDLEGENLHLLQIQINMLSAQLGKSEIEIFKEEAMRFFVYISDRGNEFRFKSILRTKLIETINDDLWRLDNSKERKSRTISNILQLSKFIDEWKGENFSLNIRKQISKLKELHIANDMDWMGSPNSQDKSSEIKLISNQILEELNRDNNIHHDHTP